MLVAATFVVKMSDLILVKKITTGRRQHTAMEAAFLVPLDCCHSGPSVASFSSFFRSCNLCGNSLNVIMKLEKEKCYRPAKMLRRICSMCPETFYCFTWSTKEKLSCMNNSSCLNLQLFLRKKMR